MTNQEFIESIALEGEEWRDVVGYEGYYMVSSFGRVCSLNRLVNNRFKDVLKPARLMTLSHNEKSSPSVILSSNSKSVKRHIARLVAETFIPNSDSSLILRHKDNNNANNRITNLEWCPKKDKHSIFDTSPLPNEEWRDIPNFEGLYQISSMGRILSIGRKVESIKYALNTQDRILSPFLTKNGYQAITLVKDKRKYRFYIHRLVGQSFIANPHNLAEIDHINTNRTDNRASNLQWCSRKGNMNNPISRENVRNALLGKLNNHSSKSIVQLKDGVLIATFPSIAEAGRTGYDTSCICEVLNGTKKLYRGYKWAYFADYEAQVSMSKNSNIPIEN